MLLIYFPVLRGGLSLPNWLPGNIVLAQVWVGDFTDLMSLWDNSFYSRMVLYFNCLLFVFILSRHNAGKLVRAKQKVSDPNCFSFLYSFHRDMRSVKKYRTLVFCPIGAKELSSRFLNIYWCEGLLHNSFFLLPRWSKDCIPHSVLPTSCPSGTTAFTVEWFFISTVSYLYLSYRDTMPVNS